MSDVAPPAAPGPLEAPAASVSAPAPAPVSDPTRTALTSPWGHAVAGGLALLGIVLNVVGAFGFPGNAPVEQIMNAGITIDLVAVVIACGIGFGANLRTRPARPARVFPWIALGLSVVALIAWAVTAGGLFETLFAGGRGRYMNDTSGAFTLGIPWTLGAIFGAFGLRRRTTPLLAGAAWAAIALWAVVLIGVIASALLYGADLTD